jgi:hypothetical protein
VTTRGRFPIEVSATTAPDGRTMVLLQLPDGHVLMTSDDARKIAALLTLTAEEVDDRI